MEFPHDAEKRTPLHRVVREKKRKRKKNDVVSFKKAQLSNGKSIGEELLISLCVPYDVEIFEMKVV